MKNAIYVTALLCLLLGAQPIRAVAQVSVPACTAYAEPDPESADISEQGGVTNWTSAKTQIAWYGRLATTGNLTIGVTLRLPAGQSSKLALDVAGKRLIGQAQGHGAQDTQVNFGAVTIRKSGYYRFALTGLAKSGASFGDLRTLTLAGQATTSAHFNLTERRNAASVHLIYPYPGGSHITAFYNEVTVRTEPTWSYYMACGFDRGYFGIQVNSPTERRIIFSVWDSGNEAISRDKVAREDRVQLLAKGDNVVASDFGNEGTGGHSHMVYPWVTAKTYRFLVTAQPDGTHTTYTGWFYFPEKRAWGLIASFRAPKDGAYMRGLYSFNENFGGANGQLERRAEFGNQWVLDGQWKELLTARFSHDGHGKANRTDYSGGVINRGFFLSNGGFKLDGSKYGDVYHRPGGAQPPVSVEQIAKLLQQIPAPK